jgi:hypothetical protein
MYVFNVQLYGQKERKEERNETVEHQNRRGESILTDMREMVWRLHGLDVVTLFVGDLTTHKIRVSEDMSRHNVMRSCCFCCLSFCQCLQCVVDLIAEERLSKSKTRSH